MVLKPGTTAGTEVLRSNFLLIRLPKKSTLLPDDQFPDEMNSHKQVQVAQEVKSGREEASPGAPSA